MAAAKQTFVIGYSVLAAGAVIAVLMIESCIFCCSGRKRRSENRKRIPVTSYRKCTPNRRLSDKKGTRLALWAET